MVPDSRASETQAPVKIIPRKKGKMRQGERSPSFWPFMADSRLCSKENFRQPFGLPCILVKVPRPQIGRPNENFGEPFGLPSIPAWVPRLLKLVVRVHLMKKYFVRTRILLASSSSNSVILAFGFDKNPHVIKVFVPFRYKTRNVSNAAEFFRF